MDAAPRIDLHAHTTHSDGTMTPTELVEAAASCGLAALAVTDHDITSGLAEAREAGEATGVEIIDGCEISTAIPSGIVHILAYAFDVENDALQALLSEVRRGREARNTAILEKLAELNMPLEKEDVLAFVTGREQ